MKYKHIVFDVDGTLLDSEQAVLQSMQDVLFEVTGRKFPFEELTFALGITGADALERLRIEDIPGVLHRWEVILHEYADMQGVYAGIEQLLRVLSEGGCSLGIATSRKRVAYDHDFARFDISRYFSVVICADDTKTHKPTAGPLLKYMEITGADRGEVLYIGDSVYDSKCAENAGVDFALAVWGSHTQTTKAAYYLHEPMELMRYMDE